jgi:hypothetical protein
MAKVQAIKQVKSAPKRGAIMQYFCSGQAVHKKRRAVSSGKSTRPDSLKTAGAQSGRKFRSVGELRERMRRRFLDYAF